MNQDAHVTTWINNTLINLGRLSEKSNETIVHVTIGRLKQKFIHRRDHKTWHFPPPAGALLP